MQRAALGFGGLMMSILLALAAVPHAANSVFGITAGMVSSVASEQQLKLTGVGKSTAYLPTGTIRGTMLLLSDEQGWTPNMERLARTLSHNGFAVAGISTPAFRKAFYAGKGCANPNFMLTAIAKDFEHRLGFAHYDKPALVGTGTGASLVYGAVAIAPPNIYRGGITVGLSPYTVGTKVWCKSAGVTMSRTDSGKTGPGWQFAPATSLPAPLLAIEGPTRGPATSRFLAGAPQAQTLVLQPTQNWMTALSPKISPWFDKPVSNNALGDLPITVTTDPSAPPSDTMAVMYSGDGGWAGIDREIATGLAAKGVPVVGMDSLAYFWKARTPQGAGDDLDQIITHYSRILQKPKVMLIGYSFGADNLAYMVGTLPEERRAHISRVTFIGLSPHADFQFHLSSWLDVGGKNTLPTIPAIRKLHGMPLQCIHGAKEEDSACTALPTTTVRQDVLPGGHHFGGNTALLASTILQGLSL